MPLSEGPPPERWNALALAADNVFATHTWASTWWDHYGDGATPHVLVDDPADPRVVLPVVETGRGLRQLRLLGHGPADELGPACALVDLPTAGEVLAEALGTRVVRADVVLLQDLPGDAEWWEPAVGRGGASTVSTEPSPVLDLAGHADWDAYLASCSRNLRGQVRRKISKLEREHDVHHRLADARTLEADLDTFFDLHARRWAGEPGEPDSPVLEPRQRAFTADFARAALGQGWLRLWTLDLDGEAVASAFQLAFGTAVYSYQFGRDPRHDALSVGFVQVAHTIRHALESGAAEYRFLRGDEDYKRRFATRDPEVRTVALPRTTRGRVAAGIAVARRRRQATRDGGAAAEAS